MSTEVEIAKRPRCQMCFQLNKNEDALYDARVEFTGIWAYMCQLHFDMFGPGKLGTGFGQKLVVKP